MRTSEPASDDDDEFVFERRYRGLKFEIPRRRILATFPPKEHPTVFRSKNL
jgi:hypothetical protein